jgi:hypothetical protein
MTTTRDERPRCRVCEKPVRVIDDGLAGAHNINGVRCYGYRRPIAGEPPCDNCGPRVGRMSWPEDLRPAEGEGSASTYVCAHPDHQADAAEWVRSITGHKGVFVPSRRMANV